MQKRDSVNVTLDKHHAWNSIEFMAASRSFGAFACIRFASAANNEIEASVVGTE